jgi:hypothetical protein
MKSLLLSLPSGSYLLISRWFTEIVDDLTAKLLANCCQVHFLELTSDLCHQLFDSLGFGILRELKFRSVPLHFHEILDSRELLWVHQFLGFEHLFRLLFGIFRESIRVYTRYLWLVSVLLL